MTYLIERTTGRKKTVLRVVVVMFVITSWVVPRVCVGGLVAAGCDEVVLAAAAVAAVAAVGGGIDG